MLGARQILVAFKDKNSVKRKDRVGSEIPRQMLVVPSYEFNKERRQNLLGAFRQILVAAKIRIQ